MGEQRSGDDLGFAVPGTAEEIAAVLRARFGTAGQAAAATLEPALRFLPGEETAGGAPIGTSKYGGEPDLPVGTEWPAWTTPSGERRPLRFYAQVDLAATAVAPGPIGLPGSGLLSFFADFQGVDEGGILGMQGDEQPAATILHTLPGVPLARLGSPIGQLPEALLVPVGCWSWRLDRFATDDDDQSEAYIEFEQRYDMALRGGVLSGQVQLGGFDRAIQNPAAEEVVWALERAAGPGAAALPPTLLGEQDPDDWRLVMWLDAPHGLDGRPLHRAWVDGELAWLARKDDLAADRWDRAMLNFQR